MPSLRSELKDRQFRQAVEVMHTLICHSGDSNAFVSGALEQLPSLVSSDLTTLSLCDLKSGTRKVFGRQAEALSGSDRAIFDLHFREHPLVRFHGSHPDGPTQRITDCVDGRAFKHSALYADYYARLGIRHVMALPLQINERTVLSVVFNRSTSDFQTSERALFEAIRPQLSVLYRNLIAREEAQIGIGRLRDLAASNGWHVVRVDRTGKILHLEPQTLRLLRRYFPRVRATAPLPASLMTWVSRSRNWGFDQPVECGEPFTAARFATRLTVHFVCDPAEPGGGYLLMKEMLLGVTPDSLGRLSITMRECEVLALVAAGKNNPEIGMLLGISPRTVQKHLEHIFQKLGVETRTAAAVLALSAMGNQVDPEL